MPNQRQECLNISLTISKSLSACHCKILIENSYNCGRPWIEKKRIAIFNFIQFISFVYGCQYRLCQWRKKSCSWAAIKALGASLSSIDHITFSSEIVSLLVLQPPDWLLVKTAIYIRDQERETCLYIRYPCVLQLMQWHCSRNKYN